MTIQRLQGKVALITGAAKGLGEEDARIFAQHGATVILTDVDTANGERVAQEIGAAASFVRLDVRDEKAWEALILDIERRFGKLDILVNNAGIVHVGTPETVTASDYQAIMGVSLDGVVFGCKYAIAAMKRAGGGSIVNMASIAAIQGQPYVAAYSAAKGAVDAYTRSVAAYCAQAALPIRANAVLPAGMDTPMVRSMPGKFVESGVQSLGPDVQGSANTNMLGRAADVAALVLFLASDESRYISGQSIAVDFTSSITMGAVPQVNFGNA